MDAANGRRKTSSSSFAWCIYLITLVFIFCFMTGSDGRFIVLTRSFYEESKWPYEHRWWNKREFERRCHRKMKNEGNKGWSHSIWKAIDWLLPTIWRLTQASQTHSHDIVKSQFTKTRNAHICARCSKNEKRIRRVVSSLHVTIIVMSLVC